MHAVCLLQASQLVALAEGLQQPSSSHSAEGPGPSSNRQLEAVVHQHLPIFHTEHCVFCRCVHITVERRCV